MINFTNLWNGHPGSSKFPCDTNSFTNQCAIRMGVALRAAGVELSTFNGARCWHGHSPRHILRAQELADWIKNNPGTFGIMQGPQRNASSVDFLGKKGIVFIQNGWGSTDHIDVWDGYNMKGGQSDYFSKGAVWFWEL